MDGKNEIVAHFIECKYYTGSFMFQESVAIVYKKFDCEFIPELIINNDTIVESDSEVEDDLKPISSLLREDSVPPKNSKTPLPRFLPDCLRVLRSNEDAELVEKVLQRLPTTFASASRLSRQMNAASAFNTLLTISDQFEPKDFDQFRHNSLQCVFLDQIKIVSPEIIENLFKSNKLVLGQKMELLTLISSTAQTIFSSKGKEDSQKSLEAAFMESEKASKLNHKSLVINDFLDNFCFPFMANAVRSFHLFERSHVMFLEKFLWLQGIILNYSQNSLSYDRIVEKYFDLIRLALSCKVDQHKLVEQVPIQKALLIGISVVLTAWPAALPVIQFYPRLQEIYAFLDEIVVSGPGFQEDKQLQALGTSVALALQDLTDSKKLLQESADQLAFDMKSVKITKSVNVEGAIYK